MKIGVPKTCHIRFLFSFLGALAGYLVFHPYLMIAYSLSNVVKSEGLIFKWQWKGLSDVALSTFKPFMLPMGISFIVFGAIAGFLTGVIVDKRRRLHLIELENERRRTASETLHQLMVTLSHYLLNANMIIGGMVHHCKKKELDQDTLESLNIIGEQAVKIDAVIKALKKITEIKTTPYTSDGQALLLDISRELAQLLNEKTEEVKRKNKK